LQTDIQAIANGTATAETVASYTTDVLTYIATDQNIDADEITPDISAIADSASTSEDTPVDINVLANDSYLTSAPITVTTANGTNGTSSLSNNSITYTPNADFNGTDTFTYTITQGDKTSSADVIVTIGEINDAPSINSASTISVAENQTAVTTISISDPDSGDVLTLSLSGSDAESFDLSTDNVLTFVTAPDYETKSSYSITLSLTDGTETVTKDITVTVTNVNDVAPVFTSEATFSAAENQTAIETASAKDADGDSITFTVSGTELAITSAGVLTFVSAPDFETKASYTATVTATDGVNSVTQDITVTVTNVNDVLPLWDNGSGGTIPDGYVMTLDFDENDTEALGFLRAYDDIENDAISYSFSGNDASYFEYLIVDAEAGTAQISFISPPDYETKDAYDVSLIASDGVNTISLVVELVINNLNDVAPTITSLTTLEAEENQKAIGSVTATDPEGGSFSFFISGADASLVTISANGVLSFINEPDYETKTAYEFIVTVSDGINSSFKIFNISIKDVDDVFPTSGYSVPKSIDVIETQE
jgi:serralysin